MLTRIFSEKALCVVLALAVPLAAAAEEPCVIAREGYEVAVEIRRLASKKEVPCVVQNREQVKNYVLDLLRTKVPPEKLRREGLVYRAVGILPESYNYEQGLVDLYVSQLAGYYDPDKERFVMAGWMPPILQTAIAVHELTHALQDQHFDLDSFIDHKIENSDLLLSRSALVEGDATAVMIDYTRKLTGLPPLAQEKNVEGVMLQNVVSGSIVSSAAGVPRTLQMILLFPYTSGLRFAHTLLQQGGYSVVDRAFKSPPQSTEEILHPDKYGKSGERTDFSDAEVAPGGGEVLYRDTFGEFIISALLGAFLHDGNAAAQAAAGWGGDRLLMMRSEEGGHTIRWRSRWDTVKDAEEFETAYRRVLDERYPESAADRRATMTREDRDVLVVFERGEK